MSTGRAKYLLSQLERQHYVALGESPEAPPDWSGKSVSIEHIFAESSNRGAFASGKEYERFLGMVNTLANYTLLERTLNRGLGAAAFEAKAGGYAKSKFALTQELARADGWSLDDADSRLAELANLAVGAWPGR